MEVLSICEDFVLMITALELPIKKTDNDTRSRPMGTEILLQG
jgi:hypothetical protein